MGGQHGGRPGGLSVRCIEFHRTIRDAKEESRPQRHTHLGLFMPDNNSPFGTRQNERSEVLPLNSCGLAINAWKDNSEYQHHRIHPIPA